MTTMSRNCFLSDKSTSVFTTYGEPSKKSIRTAPNTSCHCISRSLARGLRRRGVARHAHLAGLAQRFTDAGEGLAEIELAHLLDLPSQFRHVVGKLAMAIEPGLHEQ